MEGGGGGYVVRKIGRNHLWFFLWASAWRKTRIFFLSRWPTIPTCTSRRPIRPVVPPSTLNFNPLPPDIPTHASPSLLAPVSCLASCLEHPSKSVNYHIFWPNVSMIISPRTPSRTMNSPRSDEFSRPLFPHPPFSFSHTFSTKNPSTLICRLPYLLCDYMHPTHTSGIPYR